MVECPDYNIRSPHLHMYTYHYFDPQCTCYCTVHTFVSITCTPHTTSRSLSYTLAMAGSGFLLLAMFYTLIDVLKLWNGAPFKYPGNHPHTHPPTHTHTHTQSCLVVCAADQQLLSQIIPFSIFCVFSIGDQFLWARFNFSIHVP